MSGDAYIALLHHPVLDREGKVITTAVTNMDLHDLARLARTFELRAFYVVQPLELQRRLCRRLISYWIEGRGGEYNLTRKQAFERVRLSADLEEVVAEIEKETGSRPRVVGTSARERPGTIASGALRQKMIEPVPWLILFGTGWGMEPGFLAERADFMLEPIRGLGDYNHLSVRTAAAIVLDRLVGEARG